MRIIYAEQNKVFDFLKFFKTDSERYVLQINDEVNNVLTMRPRHNVPCFLPRV